jgi:peptidyl-prolyl cis-trans isomerase C
MLTQSLAPRRSRGSGIEGRATALLVCCGLIALLAGCSRASSPKEGTEGTTAAPASTASPAPAAEPAEPVAVKPVPEALPSVVARVNGHNITKADLEKAIRSIENREGAPVPTAQRDRVFRGVLDELIAYRLLIQESESRKVTVSDDEINARVANIRQQFPSEDAFKSMLAQQKVTLEQVRADTKQALGVERLVNTQIESKIAVKPEDVAEFYQQNPNEFRVPEQVRASHILIRVPEGADATTKATALARAQEVLKSAKAGKDFAALAKEYSQDPGSAANGGDLGVFPEGQMVKPFNDVAFSLAPGSISDVVETEFGYHIIKVVQKQPSRVRTLDETRPRIEQHLQNVNRQRETQAFVRGLRSKGKVEIFI